MISESDGGEGPGTLETGTIGVAPANSMRTHQSNDLLVAQARQDVISTIKGILEEDGTVPHTVEDIPDMRGALRGVGESAIWSSVLSKAINASWPPRNLGSTHFLNSGDTTESPQVTVADPRKLGLNLLQQNSGNMQAIVSTMKGLRLETHSRIVAAQLIEP